jgi:hypothetical protein
LPVRAIWQDGRFRNTGLQRDGTDPMAFKDGTTTTQLAGCAGAIQYSDQPEAVRREAVRSWFNILGCFLDGARHHGVDIADTAVGRYRAGPIPRWADTALGRFTSQADATPIGRGCKADGLHAALINRLSSGIYSFDDIHEQARVHPSGRVVADSLAPAELRPVSGQAFLAALLWHRRKHLRRDPAPAASAPLSPPPVCSGSTCRRCAPRSRSPCRRRPAFERCRAVCARR